MPLVALKRFKGIVAYFSKGMDQLSFACCTIATKAFVKDR